MYYVFNFEICSKRDGHDSPEHSCPLWGRDSEGGGGGGGGWLKSNSIRHPVVEIIDSMEKSKWCDIFLYWRLMILSESVRSCVGTFWFGLLEIAHKKNMPNNVNLALKKNKKKVMQFNFLLVKFISNTYPFTAYLPISVVIFQSRMVYMLYKYAPHM